MRESKFNLRNKGNRYSHWIFSRLDTNLNYSISQWRRFFLLRWNLKRIMRFARWKNRCCRWFLFYFRSLTFAVQKLFVFRSSALCALTCCKVVVEEMQFSKFLERNKFLNKTFLMSTWMALDTGERRNNSFALHTWRKCEIMESFVRGKRSFGPLWASKFV